MKVTINGSEFDVVFSMQWHRPPRSGTLHAQRIMQTTFCDIVALNGTAHGSGAAHCSIADRYNYMRGCRLALERAVNDTESLGKLGGVDIESSPAIRAFMQVVMPALAIEQAGKRKRSGQKAEPSRRQLLRALDRSSRDMAILSMALTVPGFSDEITDFLTAKYGQAWL